MHARDRLSRRCGPTVPGIGCLVLGVLLWAEGPRLGAQPVISAPTAIPLVPPSLRPPPPAPAPGSQAAQNPLVRGTPRKSPFQWGSIAIQPHVYERFIYSDGLQATPGRQSNSYINSFSPGFLVDIGANWTVDYTPTWTYYTNKVFRESVDHLLSVAGTLSRWGWAAQFTETYSATSSALVETARQTDQENTVTRLALIHNFDRNLSAIGAVSQNLQFIESAPDTYTWGVEGWIQYRVTTNITLGAGGGIAYTDVVPGANMLSYQPQAKIAWVGRGKLTFDAHGGYEIRQIYSRGVSARYTPVFGLSGRYQMFQNTIFNLTADRTVSPSVLRNQVTDRTMWKVGFSQRLLQRFNVSGNYGEQESGYSANVSRVTSGRKDRSYFYDARLSTTVLKRGTVALLCQGTENSTNAAGFGFTSTQVGVEVGYRY